MRTVELKTLLPARSGKPTHRAQPDCWAVWPMAASDGPSHGSASSCTACPILYPVRNSSGSTSTSAPIALAAPAARRICEGSPPYRAVRRFPDRPLFAACFRSPFLSAMSASQFSAWSELSSKSGDHKKPSVQNLYQIRHWGESIVQRAPSNLIGGEPHQTVRSPPPRSCGGGARYLSD